MIQNTLWKDYSVFTFETLPEPLHLPGPLHLKLYLNILYWLLKTVMVSCFKVLPDNSDLKPRFELI